MKKMNVLSLFDGMSCGQIALEIIGVKVDKYFASEIKKDGIMVTKANYPNTIHIGDVTKVSYKDGILHTENGSYEVEIDLLIGGSPCQNFSIACISEQRRGLEGVKSKLFYEYLRILKEVNPKNFFLENVASMSKTDEQAISEYLGVNSIKVNSSITTAGLRNRLYWTDINNGDIPKQKPIEVSFNTILTDGWSNREKARCLMEGDSRPLTTPVKMFHRYISTGFTSLIFKDKKHYTDCLNHYNEHFKGKSATEIELAANVKSIDLSIYEGVRYLNQNELEILQCVPKGYTSMLTRNQAAGLLGDGWNVSTVSHFFKYL